MSSITDDNITAAGLQKDAAGYMYQGNNPSTTTTTTTTTTASPQAKTVPATNFTEEISRNNLDHSKTSTTTTTTTSSHKQKPSSINRRPICPRCGRPTPKACICEGLPNTPLQLNKCHVLILQHPHEERRKNRSLPLVQLCCLDSPSSMTVVVTRRLGIDMDARVLSLLQQSPQVLLVFPPYQDDYHQQQIQQIQKQMQQEQSSNAAKEESTLYAYASSPLNPMNTMTLSQARDYCRNNNLDNNNNNNNNNNHNKTLIVMLDATWKYAKEMDRANRKLQLYPQHMKRVALSWDDRLRPASAIVPCRFDIRTPPSQVHLSTAECLAWVLQALEQDDDNNTTTNGSPPPACELYDTLMKPLDVMVKKWHECRQNAVDNAHPHHHRKKYHFQQQTILAKDAQHEQHTPTNQTEVDDGDDKHGTATTTADNDDDNENNIGHDSNRYHTATSSTMKQDNSTSITRASFFTMGDEERKGGRKRQR